METSRTALKERETWMLTGPEKQSLLMLTNRKLGPHTGGRHGCRWYNITVYCLDLIVVCVCGCPPEAGPGTALAKWWILWSWCNLVLHMCSFFLNKFSFKNLSLVMISQGPQKTSVIQEELLCPWQNENWWDLLGFHRDTQSIRTTSLPTERRYWHFRHYLSELRNHKLWLLPVNLFSSPMRSTWGVRQHENMFLLCLHLVKPSPTSRGAPFSILYSDLTGWLGMTSKSSYTL